MKGFFKDSFKPNRRQKLARFNSSLAPGGAPARIARKYYTGPERPGTNLFRLVVSDEEKITIPTLDVSRHYTAATSGSNFFYLGVEKSEALVDVLDLVDPHFSGVGLAELLAGNDLQQPHQVLPVGLVSRHLTFFCRHFCSSKVS